MALIKEISFKHGISEKGNLQTFQIMKVVRDDKVVTEVISKPYTPADYDNMAEFDQISKDIVDGIMLQKVQDDFKAEQITPKGTGLEEIVTYDRTIDDLGRISVRRVTRIFDEGKEISKKYHRSWIMPGDDPKDDDVMSKAVADKLHTPEVIAAYQAKMAELSEELHI